MVLFHPSGEAVFIDLPGRESKDACGRMRGIGAKAKAVQAEEDDERREGDALVAIDERVVSRQAERIARRQDCKISLAIGVFIDRPRERGVQKAEITKAVRASEQRELLAVDIDHEIYAEPDRLGHFASALNVSA